MNVNLGGGLFVNLPPINVPVPAHQDQPAVAQNAAIDDASPHTPPDQGIPPAVEPPGAPHANHPQGLFAWGPGNAPVNLNPIFDQMPAPVQVQPATPSNISTQTTVAPLSPTTPSSN